MGKMILRCSVDGCIFVFALVLVLAVGVGRICASEEEEPCGEEIAKFCKDVRPGGGRILNCLDEHRNELSDICRNKLEGARQRLMEAQRACTGDVERFCNDVRPGQGRIVKCLREHTEELSTACRKIAERKREKTPDDKGPRQ